jgi:hypothetical protein
VSVRVRDCTVLPDLAAVICTVEVPAGVTGALGVVGALGAVDWTEELPPPHPFSSAGCILRKAGAGKLERSGISSHRGNGNCVRYGSTRGDVRGGGARRNGDRRRHLGHGENTSGVAVAEAEGVTLQTSAAFSGVFRVQPVAVTVYSCLLPCDTGAAMPVMVVPSVFTSSAIVTAVLVEPTGVVGNTTLPVGVRTPPGHGCCFDPRCRGCPGYR